MPLTYLAHQVPVFALKLGRPRWFDGTALALGSMAPDWSYALEGSRFAVDFHGPVNVLRAVPVAVVAAIVLRRVAPTVAGYLPSLPSLPLRRLGAIGSRRPPLLMTVVSALIGALTHVFWDSFTHAGRWGARTVPWLRETHDVLGYTATGAKLAQQSSTLLGAVLGLVLLGMLLRRLPEGGEPGPAPGRFWAAVAAGTLAGAVWGYDAGTFVAGAVIRCSLGIAAGVVLGALIAQRGRVRSAVH
ncbi:DUF4184 family protein [Cryptosporangium aurantiacum]|uniref:Uncharacterized protein n=1 Tax=Cryptosporangium aurantiacum TaxID=134849 RepID=A0A1M7RJI5_9ACTN|nr:DUF4184 family protein [Cryptosporangium aurantiacum]SHN46473.1 protein of unknown function [Cryptosporangium aurantiacum]